MLLVVGFLMFKLMRRYARRDFYVVFFTLFAFTCVVDLLLAATIHGSTDYVSWYLSHGEPYFLSSYGFAINVWDATAHYAMYMTMIYGLTSAHPTAFRPVFLAWAGSVIVSLIVLLAGMAIGEHSHAVCLSTFLNIPYLFIPVFFCKRVRGGLFAVGCVCGWCNVTDPCSPQLYTSWLKRPDGAGSTLPPPSTAPLAKRVATAAFFVAALAAVIAVCTVRFLAASASKAAAATAWRAFEPILDNDFFLLYGPIGLLYIIPLAVFFLWGLVFGVTPYSALVSRASLLAKPFALSR